MGYSAQPFAFAPARTRGDYSRDLDRALSGASSIHSVPLLCAKLRDVIGNPDLADAINCIERIYEAEPQAHWEASAELSRAAQDICDQNLID